MGVVAPRRSQLEIGFLQNVEALTDALGAGCIFPNRGTLGAAQHTPRSLFPASLPMASFSKPQVWLSGGGIAGEGEHHPGVTRL
jgi:hypothetical protein